MALRAKLRPIQKIEIGNGDDRQVTVRLTAASGPENTEWSRYTPAATFDISLKGDLADRFEIGRDYFVDITEATE
jgi:hypothetical protein